MPSGKTARPHITDNKDGTVTVKYAPTEKGLHEMDIKYDGNHIPGDKSLIYLHLYIFVIIILHFFKSGYQKRSHVFILSVYFHQQEVHCSSTSMP